LKLQQILYQLETRQRKSGWLFVYDKQRTDRNIAAGAMCEGGAGYSMGA